jgi:hypothetical protein
MADMTSVGVDRETYDRLMALATADRRSLIGEIRWLLDREDARRMQTQMEMVAEQDRCERAS